MHALIKECVLTCGVEILLLLVVAVVVVLPCIIVYSAVPSNTFPFYYNTIAALHSQPTQLSVILAILCT